MQRPTQCRVVLRGCVDGSTEVGRHGSAVTLVSVSDAGAQQ